jgi:hypothetical protein
LTCFFIRNLRFGKEGKAFYPIYGTDHGKIAQNKVPEKKEFGVPHSAVKDKNKRNKENFCGLGKES